MENQVSSKSTILNYGLYMGITSILLALIKYASGMMYEQEFYSGIAGFIVLITFIILGIKKHKADNNGLITFGQSIKVGLGVTFIATLIIVAYYALFAMVIEPEFMERTIDTQRIVWADSFGMSEGQIEEMEKATRDFFYVSLFGGVIIMNLFIGGVVSLIAGAVMKRTEEEQY